MSGVRMRIPAIAPVVAVVCLTMMALPARAASTEALLKLIGFDSFVESFVEALRSTDEQISGTDEDANLAWDLAASQVFPPAKLMEEIVASMDGTMDPEDIKEATIFFETGLGKLVTQMEVDAQSLESGVVDERGSDVLADLIENNPDRVQAYTDMIDALGAIEAEVAAAMNLNLAIYSGMSRSGRMGFQLSDAEILELVSSQHDMFRSLIRDQIYITFAYTYRNLSDADLRTYTEFLSSGAGKALYSNIHRATEDVFGQRAQLFGERVMELQGVKEL